MQISLTINLNMVCLNIARVEVPWKRNILHATSLSTCVFPIREKSKLGQACIPAAWEFEQLTLPQQYIMLHNTGQYLDNMIPKLLIPNKS